MTDASDLPKVPGAYALLIELKQHLTLPIARLSNPTLKSGRYVYCGSANGPGGLAARIKRHLSRDKTIHWHVDHLTLAGEIVDVYWQTRLSECEMLERISLTPNADFPVAGFGSSDCKICPSHLSSVENEFILSPSLFR